MGQLTIRDEGVRWLTVWGGGVGQFTIRDGGVRWFTVWGGGVGQLTIRGGGVRCLTALGWRDGAAYHQVFEERGGLQSGVEGWVSLVRDGGVRQLTIRDVGME